jgi:DNA-binding MarR family transcriptional regulator
MPPVKHKKTPAPKTSATAPPPLPPVTPSGVPGAADSSTPVAPPSTAIDVADQLHSAAIHLLRRLRIRDHESGIGPAQLSALSVLVFGGPRSLGELADAEQVRPPTMSRVVAGLERSGLVRRHATEDGRRVRLSATAKGTKILWEGRRRRVETLAKALAALNENETQQLREAVTLLQQVIRAL